MIIVTTHKNANTSNLFSLPFIIKKLKALCKEIATKKPTNNDHLFLNPLVKKEIPIAIPIVPLATVCRRFAPKNLSWSKEVALSKAKADPLIENGFIKNRVFSSAAKPKAAVTI